ncbi:uncharacterized protein LOC130986877 [Salvia miltiorrhiza]|uniref:uncharacterized protein LOC130986877 n=1 Tax=Salvia miltiorrhiza TaxID=226208 RepID=UPI0025AC0059|nr:uncharacterized protein LOC130986877 [Salvia miltiorrhiza]
MSRFYPDLFDFDWMASLQTWVELTVIEDRCREEAARRASAQEGKRPIPPSTPCPLTNSGEEPVSASSSISDAYPDSFFFCEENWEHRNMSDAVESMMRILLPAFFLLPIPD